MPKQNWEEELFYLSKYYLEDDKVRLDIDQKELEKFISKLLSQTEQEVKERIKKELLYTLENFEFNYSENLGEFLSKQGIIHIVKNIK